MNAAQPNMYRILHTCLGMFPLQQGTNVNLKIARLLVLSSIAVIVIVSAVKKIFLC